VINGGKSVSAVVRALLLGLSLSIVFSVLTVFMLGCARAGEDPIIPIENNLSVAGATASSDADAHDPHMLWGQWTLYFNEDHTSVDVVPLRQARLHLNALKFLESYCADCLQITKIKNNGDGTIDLTVRITHPFNGFPQYTGFDVKGIIMFNGSLEFPLVEDSHIPLPKPFCRISWREMGDPEVLNPDGYAYRWTPAYDSGSDLPIFNYWEGKYATGVPNADLNAYMNFYSQEERHIFRTDATVFRTYRIWLPPGPIVAGYAVEACWEPPLVTPVFNPVTDFPPTANQPEAYYLNAEANNGGKIIDSHECCGDGYDCHDLYIEQKQWGGLISNRYRFHFPDGSFYAGFLDSYEPCLEGRYVPDMSFFSGWWGNGTHRILVDNHRFKNGKYEDYAFAIFDITVNDPNLD